MLIERVLPLGIFRVKVTEQRQTILDTIMGNVRIIERSAEKRAFLEPCPTQLSSTAEKRTENREA